MSFQYEMQVYHDHLMEMLGVDFGNEGKFIVIKGDEIAGPFDTYESALEAGYDRHGLGPFLVKKLERNETVLYFSRDMVS